MGKVKKGQKCNVEGCENNAVTSISVDDARILEEKGIKFSTVGRRIYLCETHYKMFKKVKKKIEKLERWRLH